MILKDLYDLVLKRKRKKNRVKAVKKIAVGMGAVSIVIAMLFTTKWNIRRKGMKMENSDAVQTIKNTVEKEAETLKKSAVHVDKEVGKVYKDISKIKENVKEDVKDGLHETKKEIHKTVKNISKELDNL